MKKIFPLAVIIGVAALGWFGLTHLKPAETPRAAPAVAAAPASTPKPALPTPPAATPVSAPATPPTAPSPAPVVVARKLAPTLSTSEKINLVLSLDADGHYHDDLRGVSANLPKGWTIRDAERWGGGNRQNTVWMQPDPPSSASPSMYYQNYPENKPDLASPEAYFRDLAEHKEKSRNPNGANDYKNVPDSFEFTQINGNPAMTYFATFTRGDEVMTEHFIRVLGQNGYVMFFTQGKLEDVKTILPQLKAMAASVKVP